MLFFEGRCFQEEGGFVFSGFVDYCVRPYILDLKINSDYSNSYDIEFDNSGSFLVQSEIANSSSALNKSLSNLGDILSSIPGGSYQLSITSGIISALVATFAAFFINYIYWRKVNRYNLLSHYADFSIDQLLGFKDICIKYWIQDGGVNNSDLVASEVVMITSYQSLNKGIEMISDLIPKKYREDVEKMKRLIEEVYDVSTGGDFQSINKGVDKKRAMKVSRLCLELQSILIKYSHRLV